MTASYLAFAILQGLTGPAPRVVEVAPGSATATIALGLRQVRDGDRLVIRAGTYHETGLAIEHRITVEGVGNPVIDAGGGGEIFTVTADSVSLTGLVLAGVGATAVEDRAAIKVLGARGCRIERNRIEHSFFGIYLGRVSGCVVRDNQVRGETTSEALSGNAIHSWSSNHLVIEDNDLSGHRDGIYFEFTDQSVIRRNRSHDNRRYGLHFMFSRNNRYLNNVIEGNGAGVAVMYSSGVAVAHNRFARPGTGAAYGLLLKDITDAAIDSNTFEALPVGLQAEGTTRVTVQGNRFRNNGWAVKVMANAVETRFLDNSFVGNSFDVATNSTHADSHFEGNYWDRYRGYDLDRDGIGDVPFAPVRLFALVVQQNEPALILQRSLFVSLLDLAERVAPALTPSTLVDSLPRMTEEGP